MYLSFYRLHDAPFNITPDPAFLYWTPGHQEAHAALTYGVDAQKGFVAVAGEVGCGKTTVLRSYLEQADPERVKVVYLINPEQDFDGVLRTMLNELELTVPEGGTDHAVEAIHQYLLESHKANRRVVLIVDEAQRMPAETMERLRILSNLETAKAKLLQIVLCGQPELDSLLARDDLRQIRERIAVRAHIKPLTPAESLACIRHRVECAGGRADQLFSRGALKEIVRRTKGNPRLLNVLCDNVLIAGFANRERPVTARTVRDTANSIGQQRERRSGKRFALAAASLCLVTVLAVAGFTGLDWVSSPGGDMVAKAGSVAPAPEAPREMRTRSESIPKETRESDVAEAVLPKPVATEPVPETVREPETSLAVPEETVLASTQATVPVPVQIAEPTAEIAAGNSGDDNAVPVEPVAPEGADVVAEPASAPSTAAVPALVDTALSPEPREAVAMAKPETPDAAKAATQEYVWITVVSGDSVEQLIERLNGHAYPSLVKRTLALNPDMTDVDLIRPGQRVAIPIVPNEPSEAVAPEDSTANAEE